MTDVPYVLAQIESGDPSAADQLFVLVYEDLRKLAAVKVAFENPGMTLQATALVHEAFLRLRISDQTQHWASRQHFFMAAAEAMRRILIDSARRRSRLKRGGNRTGVTLSELSEDSIVLGAGIDPATLLGIHEALEVLAEEDLPAAKLVKLHCFVGLTLQESAEILVMSRASVYRLWAYARAWLKLALDGNRKEDPPNLGP